MKEEKVKLLVLGGHKGLDLIEEQLENQYNVELSCYNYTEISIFIVNNEVSIFCNDRNIKEFDFVWIKSSWGMREIAQSIGCYLKKNKIPHTELEYDKSKLTDMIQLALEGIRVPNMFFAKNNSIGLFLNKIKESIAYPLIIKTTKGSQGRNIFLANNELELLEIFSKLGKRNSYIIQEYLPNKFDFRTITSGEEVLSIDRRTRQDTGFKNNAYLGATEEFLDIKDVSKELITMSIQAAKVLNLKWAGVDTIISEYDNKPYIIEVNRSPGLTAKSTEMDAALSHILKLLSPTFNLESF
jgi:predicted ATP-grasp superfamily ATP-dependent carboligase